MLSQKNFENLPFIFRTQFNLALLLPLLIYPHLNFTPILKLIYSTNDFLLSLFHTLTSFLWLSWPGFRFSISHSFLLYHPQPFHSPALPPTNVHSVWEKAFINLLWLAFAGTLNLLTHFTESLHYLHITCHYIYHSSHLHVRQLLFLLLLIEFYVFRLSSRPSRNLSPPPFGSRRALPAAALRTSGEAASYPGCHSSPRPELRGAELRKSWFPRRPSRTSKRLSALTVREDRARLAWDLSSFRYRKCVDNIFYLSSQ